MILWFLQKSILGFCFVNLLYFDVILECIFMLICTPLLCASEVLARKWLVDCWLLSVKQQIFHAYWRRAQVQQYIWKKWIYHIRVFYISFSYQEYMLNLSTPRDYIVLPTWHFPMKKLLEGCVNCDRLPVTGLLMERRKPVNVYMKKHCHFGSPPLLFTSVSHDYVISVDKKFEIEGIPIPKSRIWFIVLILYIYPLLK